MIRDIERQLEGRDEQTREAFAHDLALARRILSQKRSDKDKLYSLHAPETECISKGKAHKRYEFGVKASFATTHRSGFVVGALHCPGNPYDGHTLKHQLEQVKKLTGVLPVRCFADRGYRGHGVSDVQVFISGQRRGVTRTIRRELKRRSAIEPEIGHMKSDGHLDRCFLKGTEGDAMNIMLVAAGHNLRKILNWLRYLFVRFLQSLLISKLKVWLDTSYPVAFRSALEA